MISLLLFFSSQLASFIAALVYLPVFAFVGYQIIYLMYHSSRWWYYSIPGLPYSFFFSVFILSLALFARSRNTPTSILSISSFRWMYALVAYYAVVYFWSYSPIMHADALDNFFKMSLIMGAAFKLCSDRRSLDWMLRAYVFGSAYLGYYTYQFGRTGYGRVENVGTVDSPDVNDVAALLVPASIIALYYFWISRDTKARILFILCGAFIVNAVVLMNSRGAFLGTLCGGLYFLVTVFILSGRIRASRNKVIGIGLLGLLALVMVVDEAAIGRFTSLAQETELREDQQTGSTRVFFWMAAVRMSLDNPLGMGNGGFVYNSHLYIPENVNTGTSRNRAVHSTWFQTLTEVGYPGLFFFLIMLYTSFRMLWAVRKSSLEHGVASDVILSIAVESALISYLVCATFLDRMRAEMLYWNILFAACVYNVHFVNAKQLR